MDATWVVYVAVGFRVQVLAFNAFLGKLPHKYKLVVAGNHESTFDRQFYPFNWQQYGHRQQYGAGLRHVVLWVCAWG